MPERPLRPLQDWLPAPLLRLLIKRLFIKLHLPQLLVYSVLPLLRGLFMSQIFVLKTLSGELRGTFYIYSIRHIICKFNYKSHFVQPQFLQTLQPPSWANGIPQSGHLEANTTVGASSSSSSTSIFKSLALL